MFIDEYRDYCLAKPETSEGFPFDSKVLVFKVAGKMFALTDVDDFESVNLKCDPDRAIELREQHPSIIPGYHMSKKHWNTVMMDGSLSDEFVKELIDHSYDLVIDSLPAKLRGELNL